MDYTFSIYPNVSFISRLFFLITIGSFMYFFLADKINSLDEKFEFEEKEIQTNLLIVESIFVHLNIIYLFLVFVLKLSLPFIELDRFFKLIPEIPYLKSILLFIFFWIYIRYFIALLLSGFFAITNIRNIIMGKFKS